MIFDFFRSAKYSLLAIGTFFVVFALPSYGQTVADLILPSGKSAVYEISGPYAELMVADPAIADVLPFSPTSIYLVGKEVGSTTVSAYDRDRNALLMLNVSVGADAEGLRKSLADVIPGEENVSIYSSNGSLVVSGVVADGVVASSVISLAETYAPGRVVNLLGVKANQQVMLKVRFSEMQRSEAKKLRSNLALLSEGGDLVGQSGGLLAKSLFDGTLAGATTSPIDSFGAVRLLSGDVDMLLDALEERGLVKTLAEPTLVALSGDTASFLAGGEFPIPVTQSASSGGDQGGSGGAISVEFKDFGVSLSFTPTVLKDGLINMVVAPEVSVLAPATSISIGGLAIPGLQTRRARTTVELRDGETFAIAGLIRDDFEDSVRQVPLLGDIPILGALFRSTSFQANETELVITVTPYLVRAMREPDVRLPTDDFKRKSDIDLFLGGPDASSN
jgi:pilus assembly protein CpaC